MEERVTRLKKICEEMMARRKQSPVEDMIEITSKFPWGVGVVLAIIAYVWLHSIAGSEVTDRKSVV